MKIKSFKLIYMMITYTELHRPTVDVTFKFAKKDSVLEVN